MSERPTDEERAAFKESELEAVRNIMAGDRLCPDPSAHADHPADSAEALLREAHDKLCEFAGGGMCFRLECSTLDVLRALQASAPSPAAERTLEHGRDGPWPLPAAEGSEHPNDCKWCKALVEIGRESALALAEEAAAEGSGSLDDQTLVDIIEQAIFETDTGLAAALLASERIRAAYASQTSEGTP